MFSIVMSKFKSLWFKTNFDPAPNIWKKYADVPKYGESSISVSHFSIKFIQNVKGKIRMVPGKYSGRKKESFFRN